MEQAEGLYICLKSSGRELPGKEAADGLRCAPPLRPLEVCLYETERNFSRLFVQWQPFGRPHLISRR